MNLKKNDKIIAIVGVVILIVAAIGIVVFYQSEDTEDKEKENGMETFYVQWEKIEEPGQTITGVSEGEPYTDSIAVSVPQGSVLTNVEMRLSWEDDNTWGLIFKKGYDTLNAKINNVELETMTGSGNETCPFSVYNIPTSMEIEAETEEEAKQEAKEEYADLNSATFDVEVTINAGEKFKLLMPIRSLLNMLKDKGDDFDISVKYTYYKAMVEGYENDDDNGDDETGYKEEGTQTYVTLAYPGKN